MNRTITLAFILVLIAGAAVAQSSQKSLAATLNVYAFPQKGQTAEQQSVAEADCYGWAVKNTGTDPFQLQKQSQAIQQQKGAAQQQAVEQAGNQGTVVKEAARGAALGALVGSISGEAGKGAGYGAAAGVVAGNRRRRAEQQAAAQSVEQQSQQMQAGVAEQQGNFKKAFSVCLEGKGYMVKY